ncbi:hypothetical protein PV325_008740 [Microctonus aethiopoides]|nr:hypothetical protein PV325_008740 [Microctonus aethiopoides]
MGVNFWDVIVGENGPWDANQEIETFNNDTKYYMENLLPFTSYSFRVTAVNARGRSAPSVASHYITTLREVGKPIIVSAQNISATAIVITWKPPSLETLNGEFLGYRISYRPQRAGSTIKEIYLRNRKIEVFNPEGTGPNTSVTVMTDEGTAAAATAAVELVVQLSLLLNLRKIVTSSILLMNN